jgi:hypothetical protein
VDPDQEKGEKAMMDKKKKKGKAKKKMFPKGY